MNAKALFVATIVLGVFAFIPLVAILAVNIVFSQEIAYSFVNWFWMLVLFFLFGNFGKNYK